MKQRSCLLALACLGATLSASAWAGPHTHVGVVIGAGPFWGPPPPFYAPYPYHYPYPYYVPAPVVVQPTPPVYVQQPEPVAPAPAAAAAPAAVSYWYYCVASKAYYPYVKECPAGWQRVSPQPPTPQ